jgi:hypothetical protein
VGDLTVLIKLVMLIEQFPSIDGSVDTGSEIIAEASIFRAFDAQLLAAPVLDFLAKAVEVLNCREGQECGRDGEEVRRATQMGRGCWQSNGALMSFGSAAIKLQ